jgi:hypothetical protein
MHSVSSWDTLFSVRSPAFDALASALALLEGTRWPERNELQKLMEAHRIVGGGGVPLRLTAPVAPRESGRVPYELRVFDRGEVEHRDRDWHDLFNALVWLAFPRTKAMLNRRHRNEIIARRGEPQRGTARDVLTLFDEGGVVVGSADAGLSELLRGSRWKELFWTHRLEVLRSMRFQVFGHALYEKAVEPYHGVTAKALIVDVGSDVLNAPIERRLAELDVRAALYFSGTRALASTRSLPPLPILGIPGWDPANERESYYDDVSQFRPARPPA